MWQVVLSMVRARWASFAGMFVALGLGTAIMTAMGLVLVATTQPPSRAPERFLAAPVVVQAAAPEWASSLQASDRPPFTISSALASKVATSSPVTVDRTFYVHTAHGPANQVGHSWSAAAYGSYQLIAGLAPVQANEVVVPNGVAKLGEFLQITTATQQTTYVVTGLVAPVEFESAVFFADDQAARLSPKIDALVVDAPAERVRQAVGADAQVLTGDARHQLDPSLHRDRQALSSTGIVAGMAGGFAAFVIIFIVASTFAFAVNQHQRELALLRLQGATTQQLKRLILGQALVVGLAASVIGCAVGYAGRAWLGHWLVNAGVAPAWFTPSASWWPVLAVFVAGLLVALIGAWSAARRGARTKAIDALREATIESSGIPPGRLVIALIVLGFSIGMLAFVAVKLPHLVLVPQIYLAMCMLPIAALALLAPIVTPWFVRILALPFTWRRQAVGTIVLANSLVARRRTAAIVTPVVLLIGLCASLLGATATLNAAKTSELTAQMHADYVVSSRDAAGFARPIVAELQQIPQTVAATQATAPVFGTDDHNELRRYRASFVDPRVFPQVVDIPLASGDFAHLDNQAAIVSQDFGKALGEHIMVRFGDGTEQSLAIVGVFNSGAANIDMYLTQHYVGIALPTQVFITANNPDARESINAQLASITNSHDILVQTRADWLATTKNQTDTANWVGLGIVLGIASLYCLIAIINTMFMAAAGRLSDFSTLWLTGASHGQVLLVAAGEATMAFAVGAILATLATAIQFTGQIITLRQLVANAEVVLPWLPIVSIVLVGGAVAIAASVLPILMARIGKSEAPRGYGAR